MTVADDVQRAPGRPRDPRCDHAIVDATLDLLAEVGFARLSVEAVAARAGVGKATIYRRWPTKGDLVVDAVARCTAEVDTPPTGHVRDDLVALVERIVRTAQTTRAGQVMARLVGEHGEHPELAERYRDQVVQPRRRLVGGILQAGIDAGELRPDLDVDAAIDALIGPVVYRVLLSQVLPDVPAGFPAAVVDIVLDGLRA